MGIGPRPGIAAASGPAVRAGVIPRADLFVRLEAAGRVVQVSAPPGSGKTYLLRSWVSEGEPVQNAAWVSVGSEERDAQRFWMAAVSALHRTQAGSAVRTFSPAPDIDCWSVVERLLEDLAALRDRVWLVVDDAHELRAGDAARQLELLLMRSPPQLRFVLVTRHDLQLGLHRLRLEGELTEIRAGDLRFTLEEARALFAASKVDLPERSIEGLVERTEGWAAGLRLAALSLAGHPDPERFAAEFSGSDRTVAEYLLAEVLDRQSEEVRRLLLRTSILGRVNGPLADTLTGRAGQERILQELELANAFVTSLDGGRTWFRYHRLFAELLQLELRQTEPDQVPALHRAAAGWHAGHGHPAEATRHAQAAQDWSLGVGLLFDHWFDLEMNGQATTARELLRRFPEAVGRLPELGVLTAADELNRGLFDAAESRLSRADGNSASVPAERRRGFEVTLAFLRLSLASERGDLPRAKEQAGLLLASIEDGDRAGARVGDDRRTLALISLGSAELWWSALRGVDDNSGTLRDAERHLAEGVALAHRIGRPYLEVSGLAHLAMATCFQSAPLGMEHALRAVEFARQHGWGDEPVAALAYVVLGRTKTWQGQLEEAERWLDMAERALPTPAQPAVGLWLNVARGRLEAASGRNERAWAAFQSAQRLAKMLLTPAVGRSKPFLLQVAVRLGDPARIEAAVADLDATRERGESRISVATLDLANKDYQAARDAVAPVLDGSAPLANPQVWLIQAHLLDAIACRGLGDADAAAVALERALSLAEPDRVLLPFLLHPATQLLESARPASSYASLISEILTLLGQAPITQAPRASQAPVLQPLSASELRILRYLPTNLSVPEIARELYLSKNTVKTHISHLYDKLGVHHRWEAVERGRALGLVASSSRPS